jgi:hypothetical protein
VARAILLVGGVAWSIAGLAALAVAVVGVERLVSLLPPLAIDTDAVRGAVIAVAVAFGAAALAHLAVLTGLRRELPRAWSAAILLASLFAATFTALAAAAFTSAAAEPSAAVALVLAGVAAVVAAGAYALATHRLVHELRTGRPS